MATGGIINLKGNYIKASGDTGVVSSYGPLTEASTLSDTSAAAVYTADTLTVENGTEYKTWVKTALLTAESPVIEAGDAWEWEDGEVPTLYQNAVVTARWLGKIGILSVAYGGEGPQTWSITLNISDDTTYTGVMPVNLYGADDTATISVDWGDGTVDTVTASDATSSTTYATHSYSEAGEYTVTATAMAAVWAQAYVVTADNAGSSYQSSLTAVNSALPAVKTTNFTYCFYGCTSLTSIPDGLFSGCTAVTSFNYCFQNCTSLTTVGDGLFSGCTAATTFSSCFRSCTSLTSIPDGLFSGCTAAMYFSSCFYGSFLCDGSIHIGSEIVTSAGSFMSSSSSYDRYVYVPAGSTTADTFNALSITGMTVVEE